MKIECIKTTIDEIDNSVINGYMDEYLLIGSLFYVYGIKFFEKKTYVYIFNGDHLFEAPIVLFKIIDDMVFHEWRIKVWENGEVTLWPDLFYQDGFLENFAEREKKERQWFEDLRQKIEKAVK